MRRREFITAARRRGGAWPLAARAQQPAMPVIGFLMRLDERSFRRQLAAAFRQGLARSRL